VSPAARNAIQATLDRARADGRDVLLETEGLALLAAMGLETPAHLFVAGSEEAAKSDLSRLSGERVVVKVISPEILHKSDVGGVAIVLNRADNVAAAIREMEGAFSANRVSGYTINQFIAYEPSLGSELLVGARWTEDFGPVVTFGPGGIYTEFLAANLRPDRSVALMSPKLTAPEDLEAAICDLAVTRILRGGMRGQKARVELQVLIDVLTRFLQVACEFMPDGISEFEVNPFVVSGGRLVALDVLLKMPRENRAPLAAPRPIHKLKNLLEPASVAIIGVSEKMNPGHIILNNLLREGFSAQHICIIKPGSDEIEGCRCYSGIEGVPGTADLFVLAIPAAQVPGTLTELIESRKAEGIIVIPGGLEEKAGGSALVERVRHVLALSRATAWHGPVINGGNCLGIRSVPGHYDTMFIPQHKLGERRARAVSPIAFISQSGAFALSKSNKLAGIRSKYEISIGNQMDLTIADYLEYLKDDSEIEVFAVYVEGFKPLDGIRFLGAAREITRSGRTVILYRAGRTAEGAKASASHTASIAGNYAVTRELARSAGVIVMEGIDDFEDLVRLFAFLREKQVAGYGLGAVSNAGFECVAVADNLGAFKLVPFSDMSSDRLKEAFARARIDQLVDVHNPVDLTPIADDAAYDAVFRAVLEDVNVNVGLLGIVPMTPALTTLPAGSAHREDITREDSIVSRAIRIKMETAKPWVAVVDGGPSYDAMARRLEENGVPTFRTADRALRLFNLFCSEQLRRK
jgi:acyl-CoA synthetase (NDP forming)